MTDTFDPADHTFDFYLDFSDYPVFKQKLKTWKSDYASLSSTLLRYKTELKNRQRYLSVTERQFATERGYNSPGDMKYGDRHDSIAWYNFKRYRREAMEQVHKKYAPRLETLARAMLYTRGQMYARLKNVTNFS
jgi:hypothetical protein